MQSYRIKQIEKAKFDPTIQSWMDVSTLPKSLREELEQSTPFFSLSVELTQSDSKKETFKSILKTHDGKFIESVLMKNRRDQWTICVSTQIGCAMACSFCATGKMGITRNLTSDEIVDQYRLWNIFILSNLSSPTSNRISNIVYMGMGEPLANYEEVKKSLNQILQNSDIGTTHITVSTVGILPRLEQILTDKQWPHIRLAISLHSADVAIRKSIVKTSYDEFLPKLDDWCRRYLKQFGNRRHHLTFEYIMLDGVNDSLREAKKLAVYVNKIGNIKVNLIPFNYTETGFQQSSEDHLRAFQEVLTKNHVISTIRFSKGTEIAAACGQLIKEET